MFFKLRITWYLLRFRFFTPGTKAAVSQLQQRRLRKLFLKLKRSAFYNTFIQNKVPLEAFPIMNKTLMMENFDRINTVGITRQEAFDIALRAETSRDFSPTWKNIAVGLSSGTSGNRGIFLASKKERALWVAAVLHRVIGFSFKKRRIAFFLRANNNLYESVNSALLQFRFYDILFAIDEHLGKLQQQQPHILVAQPSVLLLLAKAVTNGQLKIAPAKIIAVAEVLEPSDRTLLELVFKQTIHQVYQATEGFLASTCKYGTLHFHEDTLHIEKKYVDADKTRFHPVITDLFRETQPVIRYELNDLIIEKKACACGSPFMAIEAVEGRADDVFEFTNEAGKTVHIFPDFIRRAVMLASDKVFEYEVVQTGVTEICFFVHYADNDKTQIIDQINNNLLSLLQNYNVANIQVLCREPVPEVRGIKRRRVRNDYKKSL